MLRRGSDADFDALHAIYMAEEVNPYLSFEVMGKESFRPLFEAMTREGELYVWEAAGEVAATCIVRRYTRRCAHVACIGTFAVRPDLRGAGIAAPFMKAVLDTLRAEGVRRAELFAEADNPRALRFYEKMGFTLEGTLKGYYRRAKDDHDVDEHVFGLILEGQ